MSDQDIRYSITAENRFSRTFANLRRDVASAGDAFGGVLGRVSAVSVALSTVAAGAAGGAGLGLAFKRLAHDLDALNDAADATGASIENLSALEDLALRNGGGLETVVTAALKLNKVLAEAKADSPMAQALQRIGLNAAELRTLDPAEAVQRVAVALARYANDGDKARLIQELFGKSVKEIAPFLNDLAQAGKLNARATAEQAAEAERFNKELFALSANATQAGRSLVSDLLPSVNQFFDRLRTARQTYGSVSSYILGNIGDVGKSESERLSAARADVQRYAATVQQLNDLQERQGGALGLMEQARRREAAAGLAEALQRLDYLKLAQQQSVLAAAGNIPADPRLRTASLPSVGPAPTAADKPKTDKVSEAMRYLEQLQKQGEKLQDLTTHQQLLADIENKRIDGITPKLERELKIAAQRVDLQRKLNAEKEREAGFQKLLTDKDQRDIDEVQRLLSQTTTGQLAGLESQADKLLEFSRRIGSEDPRQQQVLEAMKRLREEAAKLTQPVEEANTAFDKLADTVEKTMDRATGAIVDMAIEGKGGVDDLGKAFARDVLRALIEDPVRDTMKQVAAEIRKVFKGEDGGSLLRDLLGIFKGDGGGGGLGDLLGQIGGFFGFTGRAGGGDVKAGQLVRWQENGREWFVPQQDGTVVNQAQMRAMAGGAAPVQQVNHFHITGNPADVQRQIEAAIARNNAQLSRSRATGGAFAAA